MTNTIPNTEIDKHQNSYALRAPAYTDCVVLDSATVAASYDVPADATHIFFSATADFYAQYFTDTGNIITNGGFASADNWTAGTGWSIAAGVATATTSSAALSQTITEFPIVEGQAYRVVANATRSAGTVTPSVGGTAGSAVSSTSTIDQIIVAGSGGTVAFTGSGFSGSIDNVEVYPVAIVPGASLTGGVSPELNPTQRLVKGINRISLIAPSAGTADVIVTMNITK